MTAPSDSATRVASLTGAVAAALAASACCVGPLVFALLGLGGAGALVALEPYRPIFTAVTVALLGVGFFFTYRKPATAAPAEGDDCDCELPATNRTGKRLLWIATGVVALALVFPYLVPYLV